MRTSPNYFKLYPSYTLINLEILKEIFTLNKEELKVYNNIMGLKNCGYFICHKYLKDNLNSSILNVINDNDVFDSVNTISSRSSSLITVKELKRNDIFEYFDKTVTDIKVYSTCFKFIPNFNVVLWLSLLTNFLAKNVNLNMKIMKLIIITILNFIKLQKILKLQVNILKHD